MQNMMTQSCLLFSVWNKAEGEEKMYEKQEATQVKPAERRSVSGWWGRVWHENLEQYEDYTRNVLQGNRYIFAGTIIDMEIKEGIINAKARGDGKAPYAVKIRVDIIPPEKYIALIEKNYEKPETVKQLLSGEFSEKTKMIFRGKEGIFPSVEEIRFSCDCPDSVRMCRHILAALYEAGKRFDKNPELFFVLRGIKAENFVAGALEKRIAEMLKNGKEKPESTLDEEEIEEIAPLWKEN